MLASDATVLDRHKELLRWRQQQQQQQQQQSSHSYFGNGEVDELPIPIPITNHEISHEILGDLRNGWPDLVPGRCSIPCLTEGNFSGAVKDSIFGSSSESRKREAEETRVGKQLGVDETEDVVRVRKKMKGSAKESVQPKLEVQQSSSDNSEKENPKVPEPAQKPDYIHVRARRGQATDSHSLAERVRREKISERMKYLQDLVPGCNKITGKAGMLDEIINYVQSLQRQVEFLSMKLAAVNPRLDINIDHFFSKEMNPASCGGFPAIEMPMPTDGVDPSYLQSNLLQHAVAACGGLDMALNPQGQGPPFAWDVDIQSLYNVEFHQGRGITFPFLSSQGNIIPYNPKMD